MLAFGAQAFGGRYGNGVASKLDHRLHSVALLIFALEKPRKVAEREVPYVGTGERVLATRADCPHRVVEHHEELAGQDSRVKFDDLGISLYSSSLLSFFFSCCCFVE